MSSAIITLLVLLGIGLLLALWLMSIYNGLVVGRNRYQERLRPDRRAAETPLRPDSQPGRDRQGLHGARARDARGGHQGPQQRVGGRAEGGRQPRRRRRP